jgi:hypothetical protein
VTCNDARLDPLLFFPSSLSSALRASQLLATNNNSRRLHLLNTSRRHRNTPVANRSSLLSSEKASPTRLSRLYYPNTFTPKTSRNNGSIRTRTALSTHHRQPTNTHLRTPHQAHRPPTPLPPPTPAAAKQQATTATQHLPHHRTATTLLNKATRLLPPTRIVGLCLLNSNSKVILNRDFRHSRVTRSREASRCTISSSKGIRRRDISSSNNSRVEVVVLEVFVRVC